MVKIVGDKSYGEILGAHVVGSKATDMIQELVNAKLLEGGYPELAHDDPRPPDVLRGDPRGRPRRRTAG